MKKVKINYQLMQKGETQDNLTLKTLFNTPFIVKARYGPILYTFFMLEDWIKWIVIVMILNIAKLLNYTCIIAKILYYASTVLGYFKFQLLENSPWTI